MSRCILLGMMLGLAVAGRSRAAEPTNPATAPAAPVSREEYEKLLEQQRQLRAEVESLKKQAATRPATPAASQPQSDTDSTDSSDEAGDMQPQIDALRDEAAHWRPGTESFLLAGDAFAGFSAQHGQLSSFNAGLSPLLLWQPAPRLLFEAGADLSLNTNSDASSSTDVSLKIADVSYEVNDHLIVGAGLFVAPFGVYHNHFDPPWINKFPDDPLPFSDGGIAPGSVLGIFARGAVPISTTKLTYDVYLSNGPNLIVSDPAAAGSLSFDNFSDLNNNKAVGGRIGFLPAPNIEMGYSILSGEAQPHGFGHVATLLQAADFNYRQDVEPLGGVFELRSEWVWSDVQHAVYDPRHLLGFGPLSFSNYRDGGYVQLAYRPTRAHNSILRNVELAGRWDFLHVPPHAPSGDTESRYTAGVDYWISPQAVLKVAYEWDQRKIHSGEDALLIQLGIGF